MHSIDWNGVTIELGAQWITGCVSTNVVFELGVEQLGLKGIQDEDYAFLDCRVGMNITDKANKRMDEFEEIYDNLTVGSVTEFEANPQMMDIDLRTSLQAYGWEKPKDSLDSTIEWLNIDFELGQQPEVSSVTHNVAAEYMLIDFGDVFHYTNDRRGLSLIPQHLASKLPPEKLMLNQVIKSIEQAGYVINVYTD